MCMLTGKNMPYMHAYIHTYMHIYIYTCLLGVEGGRSNIWHVPHACRWTVIFIFLGTFAAIMRVFTCMYVCTYVCVYVRIHFALGLCCSYARVHMYVCVYVRMCKYTYPFCFKPLLQLCACSYVCMCICMYVCVFVCTDCVCTVVMSAILRSVVAVMCLCV